MKHKFLIMALLLIGVFFLLPEVYAAPTINGTGQAGSPTSKCGNDNPVCWYRVGAANDDGIRISLLEVDENGNVLGIEGIVDYSNQNHNGEYYLSYGSSDWLNKLWYKDGGYSDILTFTGGYLHETPTSTIPWTVRASTGENNMSAVKQWFSTDTAIEGVSRDLGFSCTDATNPDACELVSTHDNGKGKYKLLLEPIAYLQVKYDGLFYNIAVTPTQMAMFDTYDSKQPFYVGGPTMLYNTFAKAMFLQEDDLGFRAYTPSGGTQSINTIKNYLGMAIISFDQELEEEEDEPVGDTNITVVGEGKYRVDTDVYTSVYIDATEDITAENPLVVTFSGSNANCTKNVEIPGGERQLVWCKWHTPSTVGSSTITVTTSNGDTKRIPVTFSSLDNLDPPDPKPDDKKPRGWSVPDLPALNDSDSKSWEVWYTREYTNWDIITTTTKTTYTSLACSEPTEENPEPVCTPYSWTETDVEVENVPKFSFYEHAGYTTETETNTYGNTTVTVVHKKGIDGTPYKRYYSVSLATDTVLEHDPDNPTAKGNVMKSGYGVCLDVTNTITGNGEHTAAQTGAASFPEFNYDSYWRKLEGTSSMEFKNNKYDIDEDRVHFTPIWYPDYKRYAVRVRVLDIWTPAGMLSTSTSDYKSIKGNLYDDWANVNEN